MLSHQASLIIKNIFPRPHLPTINLENKIANISQHSPCPEQYTADTLPQCQTNIYFRDLILRFPVRLQYVPASKIKQNLRRFLRPNQSPPKRDPKHKSSPTPGAFIYTALRSFSIGDFNLHFNAGKKTSP